MNAVEVTKLQIAIEQAQSRGIEMALAVVSKAAEMADKDGQEYAVNKLTQVVNVLRVMR